MYKKKGFTLVELLLVITVIGILASLVFVNLEGARERAKIAKTLQWSQSIHSLLGADAVGIWNFNDRTAKDSSGSGNHGTIRGGAVFVDDTPSGEGWALKFDGVNDYVEVPDSASLDITDAITIELWMNVTNVTQLHHMLVSKHSTAYEVRTIHDKMSVHWTIGGADYEVGTPPGTILPNTWHHIVVTYSGSIFRIYIDNVVQFEDTTVTGLIAVNTKPVNIGKRPGLTSYLTNGLIDEVRIYERALTASEIQKRYAEGLKRLNLAGK